MKGIVALGIGGFFIVWLMRKKNKTALCTIDDTHSGSVSGTIS